jgi:hypothetical protein
MIEAEASSIGLGEEKGSEDSERWQRGARESVLAEEGLRRRGAPSAHVMPAGALPPTSIFRRQLAMQLASEHSSSYMMDCYYPK